MLNTSSKKFRYHSKSRTLSATWSSIAFMFILPFKVSRRLIVPHVSINANPDFSAFAKDPMKLTKIKGSNIASQAGFCSLCQRPDEIHQDHKKIRPLRPDYHRLARAAATIAAAPLCLIFQIIDQMPIPALMKRNMRIAPR